LSGFFFDIYSTICRYDNMTFKLIPWNQKRHVGAQWSDRYITSFQRYLYFKNALWSQYKIH